MDLLTQLLAVDFQQAGRADDFSACRIPTIEKHCSLGKALAAAEHAHNGLFAIGCDPVDLHPAIEHHIECRGMFALAEQQLAFAIGFRATLTNNFNDRLFRHGAEQRRRFDDFPICLIHDHSPKPIDKAARIFK